jgi:hypothetical protein
VLIAGDPARAGDPASAHQAMRTRPSLLPVIRREARPGRLPGLEHLGARVVPGRAGRRSLGVGQVGAPDRTAAIVMMRAISMIPADTSDPRPKPADSAWS